MSAFPQLSPLREAIRARMSQAPGQELTDPRCQITMTVQQLTETRAGEAAEALQSAMKITQNSGMKDTRQTLSPDSLPLML